MGGCHRGLRHGLAAYLEGAQLAFHLKPKGVRSRKSLQPAYWHTMDDDRSMHAMGPRQSRSRWRNRASCGGFPLFHLALPAIIRNMQNRPILILLLLLVWFAAVPARALATALPAADTSSPKSTLFGFIAASDDRYNALLGPEGLVTTYLQSSRLFLDRASTRIHMARVYKSRKLTAKYLDLSHIPVAILEQQSWRLTIQLKEILDRLPLPSAVDVPDAEAMQGRTFKKWKLPDSDITIALVESGPRAGEYLFTPETVDQVPFLYEAIKDEPRRSGTSAHMYDFLFMKPTGVALVTARVIPSRWFLEGDPWTNRPVWGEPIWRWMALLILLGTMGGICWGAFRLSDKFSGRKSPTNVPWVFLPSLSLIIMIPSVVYILDVVLEVTPRLYSHLTEALWGFDYIALTTLVWSGFRWLTEWVIKLERIKTDSTDSQLIRLGSRLLALAIAIAILIEGASRIGLPSYSIMAGLGIGGLAVALAGQQALANLLGSLIIMFEKPFRIGHIIKTGSIEGQVENIGFRTTQLRTGDGTTLIVPSSEIIRTPIENLTLRKHWRVKKSIKIGLLTSLETLSHFKLGIEALLKENPNVNEKSIRVSLAEILPEGLEIRIEFSQEAKNSAEQLRQADVILMQILDLARASGIRFDPQDHSATPGRA